MTKTYTVMVPTYEDKTVTYTVNVPYTEQVEKSYTVMVPHTEQVTKTRTVSKRVPETTMKQVQVNTGHWETQSVAGTDACGCPTTCCKRVWVAVAKRRKFPAPPTSA